MAEGVKQLDSRIEVQTPENIAFQYRAAGPFRRLPAYLADLAIRFLIMLGAGLFVAFSFGTIGAGNYAGALLVLTWFGLSWFYGGLFETYWNGQTPGKRMMAIRVVTVDGQPINAMQAVLRNILRAADSAPFFMYTLYGSQMMAIPIPLYQVGLLVPMLTERYQRLGDLACGTMVIVEEPQFRAGMLQIKEPEAIRLAEELPPNIQVTRSLGRALTKYVSRRAAFSRERRGNRAASGASIVRGIQSRADGGPRFVVVRVVLSGVHRRSRESVVGGCACYFTRAARSAVGCDSITRNPHPNPLPQGEGV